MRFMFLIGFIIPSFLLGQTNWQSEIVYYENDKLEYIVDSVGNRIPDFSYAGFKNGDENIPYIPTVKTIHADSGDNTGKIQAAINAMADVPLDENGFRGAVMLGPGKYEIWGTIHLNVSGVILRGSGDGDDPGTNTILRARGDSPHQRSVLVAGGGDDTKWSDYEFGEPFGNIVDDTVYVSSLEFTLDDASTFNVGDNIIINHPCTEEWLAAINYGGTHSGETGATEDDVPWGVGDQPIVFNRNIVAIDGNKITVDAPLFATLVKSLSPSYIYRYTRNGLKTNIGVERIRIDIETAGYYDEKHAWTAFDLWQIEDAWVRDCTALHFGRSGFRTNTATRVTIENCQALDPNSVIDGGRRYNFNSYTASQLILFTECHATNGRHHYMSNGTSWTSGIVFHRCTSSGAYTSSEGHRRWTQAMLYDNVVELDGPRPGYNPRLLGLYNRGYYGTSHGWSVIHSVAWNCDMSNGDLIVQKPPTGQNYAIGCFGDNVTGIKPPASFDEPEGYIEGTNQVGLFPESLYEAQFHERTGSFVGISIDRLVTKKEKFIKDVICGPNPFNPQTSIRFTIQRPGNLIIEVFSITGRKVETIGEGFYHAGEHKVTWIPLEAASGIYLFRITAENHVYMGKMTYLK